MQLYLPQVNDEPAKATNALVADLKANNSDFEWYPTTDEIIDMVMTDINNAGCSWDANTILDVGAGDGRVLKVKKISENPKNTNHSYRFQNRLAIEKSATHVSAWGGDIDFVGGDFYETDIASIDTNVTFCNPPYSDYENWSSRIISEGCFNVLYLVIPKRWVNSDKIKAALNQRGLSYKIIGETDFLQADRRARAKVDVVRVYSPIPQDIIKTYGNYMFQRSIGLDRDNIEGNYTFGMGKHKEDAFDRAFSRLFPNLSDMASQKSDTDIENYREQEERTYQIFKSTNHIDDMVALYNEDMQKVLSNYQKLNSLDHDLFFELKIDLPAIKNTLKNRLAQLKNQYWRAFFHNYTPINSRLTKKYRDRLYKSVVEDRTSLDFNATNALIVTQIVIEVASEYMDEQVKDFYQTLASPDGIKLYKSNQKVFTNDQWRYCRGYGRGASNPPTHYSLEYRIVQHRMFNVSTEYSRNELRHYELAAVLDDFYVIADIVGAASNKGLTPDIGLLSQNVYTGDRVECPYYKDGEAKELFVIKFFKNGNQHLFLSKEFALRLNIYAAKLFGWVKNAQEAYQEMQPENTSEAEFNNLYQTTNVQTLTMQSSPLAGYLEAS